MPVGVLNMEMTLRVRLISLVFGRADDGFSRETLVAGSPKCTAAGTCCQRLSGS
jgi:hypothetical protein